MDLDEVDESESVLSAISASARPGHTSLVAQVTEQSREVVDNAMADLGGTVVLRPVADVEAEIAAAEKAQREAKPGGVAHPEHAPRPDEPPYVQPWRPPSPPSAGAGRRGAVA